MAIIWKSRGTVGPGSMRASKSMPLAAIDEHVMIEVMDEDVQPHLDRFSRLGFYLVVGLRVPDAGFLFEPASIPARVRRVAP